MRDDFLLGAAKGGQAEDGIQDGEGSGGDGAPPVEGLTDAEMLMQLFMSFLARGRAYSPMTDLTAKF